MYSDEDNRKDHIDWLNDPNRFMSSSYKPYVGKTVEKICGYGNGEVFIFFTDGTILQLSVQEPSSGDDLYCKTE